MESIFSKSGIKKLEDLFLTKTLFAFDFDGTLAPIVTSPEKAQMSKKTSSLLNKFRELACVALISGRSISDLKKRNKIPQDIQMVGNHGLEIQNQMGISLTEEAKSCRLWIKRMVPILETLEGCELEDKVYSIAIHYRKSRKKTEAQNRILKEVSLWPTPPRVIFGKGVINLLPAGTTNKGLAMIELMKQSSSNTGFYIGDDDTDEDVFCLPNPEILTIRVGKKSKSHALYFIKTQSEINSLLQLLIELKHKTSTKNKNSK